MHSKYIHCKRKGSYLALRFRIGEATASNVRNTGRAESLCLRSITITMYVILIIHENYRSVNRQLKKPKATQHSHSARQKSRKKHSKALPPPRRSFFLIPRLCCQESPCLPHNVRISTLICDIAQHKIGFRKKLVARVLYLYDLSLASLNHSVLRQTYCKELFPCPPLIIQTRYGNLPWELAIFFIARGANGVAPLETPGKFALMQAATSPALSPSGNVSGKINHSTDDSVKMEKQISNISPNNFH